jgi:hypothetical protein
MVGGEDGFELALEDLRTGLERETGEDERADLAGAVGVLFEQAVE